MMQHNKFAGEVPETLRFYENSDESSGISGIDLSYNCFTSFPWSFSQMMMIVWYLICGEIGYLEPFQMRYLNLRSGRDGKLKYHVKRKDMDILITRRSKMSIELCFKIKLSKRLSNNQKLDSLFYNHFSYHKTYV